jgi:hypothetical protein
MGAGREAWAEGPAPTGTDIAVSVTYDVAAGCPKVDYFEQRVRDRAPRAHFVEDGDRHAFRVSAHPEEGQWVGELAALPAVDESSVRRVTGTSCGDVIAALSLIAAVAIDPAAAEHAPAPATATSEPSKPSEATPAATPKPVVPAAVAAQPAVPAVQAANAAPGPAPQSGVRPEAETRWDVEWGLDGVAAFGRAPAALFGIGAAVGAGPVAPPGRLLSWFAVLSAKELFPRDLGEPLKARFSGQFLTLEGCFLRFSFGKVLSMRPCLGVEAGRLAVGGIQQEFLATTENQSALFVAMVQSLRLGVQLGRIFGLEVIGTLVEPFRHDSFGYQQPPVPIYTIPAVSGTVALGLRVHLW